MKKYFKPPLLRFILFTVAILLVFPLTWKGLTGLYVWLSPFIMLNSAFALKTFVWLNLLAFTILIPVFFRKRWFCNNLCPLGYSIDFISSLNKNAPSTYKRLPAIGKWAAVISLSASIVGLPLFVIFDPLAIFNGFFTLIRTKSNIVIVLFLSAFVFLLIIHFFLPGLWCRKLCPLGGLQLAITDLKNLVNGIFKKEKIVTEYTNTGRRYFLMSGIGLLAGFSIPRFLKTSGNTIIRPPASLEPLLFYSLCCRCGNCIKACPTDIIIPDTDFENILSWMTPRITFDTGYCLETCNLCSQVCPTGAITLFSTEAKTQLIMGIAEIHLSNCLLIKNTECVKCKQSCKYDAINFIYQESELKSVPVIDLKKCVGCGACRIICPTACIEIKNYVK